MNEKSRIERIMRAGIDGASLDTLPPPQSRNEALLMLLIEKMNNAGSGGSGSSGDVVFATTADIYAMMV